MSNPFIFILVPSLFAINVTILTQIDAIIIYAVSVAAKKGKIYVYRLRHIQINILKYIALSYYFGMLQTMTLCTH